jgi:heme-degrading monooxygenase HmoA
MTDCGEHLFHVTDQGQRLIISRWRDSDFDEKWHREAEQEIQAKMTAAATRKRSSGDLGTLGFKEDELGDD